MKRSLTTPFILFILLSVIPFAHAGLLDKVKEYRQELKKSGSEPDLDTVIAGLKEALSIGTVNAVTSVSKENGYFGNPRIRIPLPEKLEKTAKLLSKLGMQKQVDDFLLSMNRAAEKAAPRAKELFIGAVKQMTIQDARTILKGTDTAATDYLKAKTSQQLYDAFRPLIASAMNEVGVTRSYKRMMDKAKATRLVKPEDVDLDHHVANKALEGLFHMVSEEEKKIRKDPAARVTDLLKKVFANQ